MGPFTSEQMVEIGNAATDDVWRRIRQGINCQDAPAKPLKPGKDGKPGYPERKQKGGVAPVRNWMSTMRWPRGRMKLMRALRVKAANQNRVEIGFIDPNVDKIAHINNKIDRMFGLSPKNKEFVKSAVIDMFKRTGMLKTRNVA